MIRKNHVVQNIDPDEHPVIFRDSRELVIPNGPMVHSVKVLSGILPFKKPGLHALRGYNP